MHIQQRIFEEKIEKLEKENKRLKEKVKELEDKIEDLYYEAMGEDL